ncbi:hypothetical protein ACE1SV_61440 [Streptomyces sennicomposti]
MLDALVFGELNAFRDVDAALQVAAHEQHRQRCLIQLHSAVRQMTAAVPVQCADQRTHQGGAGQLRQVTLSTHGDLKRCFEIMQM